MPLENKIKIALSIDFLKAFASIPKKEQKDVREFLVGFQQDPTATRFNYEKITHSKDKSFRSVRVNYAYRAIVHKPDKGNVYMLLWVDHHDEAYRWAQHKQSHIHPETGGIQVVPVSFETPETDVVEDVKKPEKGLFDDYKDRELSRLGVIDTLLPSVRNIKNDVELESYSGSYPGPVYEALFKLACGYSIQEIEKVEVEPVEIEADDFDAALDTDDSKQRFYVVEGEADLLAILDAPMEKWRIFLHSSQRQIVENKANNGPIRVLGGPGTGKTVVAMHRAKWLVNNFEHEKQKILLTTFTRNLAADIRLNMEALCTADEFKQIEVINLDAWVAGFLKSQNYQYKTLRDTINKQLWEKAYEKSSDHQLSLSFFKEEYESVIRPQEVDTLEKYIKASRIGRGQRVNRVERVTIWPIFDYFISEKEKERYRDFIDLFRDARLILEAGNIELPYKSIVVDEAQDMSPEAFKLIRAMIPEQRNNDLFITGDGHQRIYNHKTPLSHCGINIKGRSRRLKINYRTTEEIKSWALRLLDGKTIDDMDGGTDTTKAYISLFHGVKPEVFHFDNTEEEADFLQEILTEAESNNLDIQNICLTVRIKSIMNRVVKRLQDNDFDIYQLQANSGDDLDEPGLRVGTMHRIKGLEFDQVIISGVNKGVLPLKQSINSVDNETSQAERELQERCLLYVAATRARKRLIITCTGTPSPFLEEMKN